MNTQYLFEAYQKLPKKWQLVFLDTLEFLAEYIRVIPKFPGTITESSVEGGDIVLFTYKNLTAFWYIESYWTIYVSNDANRCHGDSSGMKSGAKT